MRTDIITVTNLPARHSLATNSNNNYIAVTTLAVNGRLIDVYSECFNSFLEGLAQFMEQCITYDAEVSGETLYLSNNCPISMDNLLQMFESATKEEQQLQEVSL